MKILKEAKIVDSVTDYYSGQMNCHMSYVENDEELGYIDYSVYNDVPYINYIKVSPEYRRQGIATKLLKELQRQFPNTEIDWGMTTKDGTALKNKITTRVENRTATKVINALQNEQKKLEEIENVLNQLYDKEELTEEEEKLLSKYGKEWDKVYKKVRSLEDVASGMKQYTYMIRTD